MTSTGSATVGQPVSPVAERSRSHRKKSQKRHHVTPPLPLKVYISKITEKLSKMPLFIGMARF
jgi:hypothetical protein